jgi:hypothetical protein
MNMELVCAILQGVKQTLFLVKLNSDGLKTSTIKIKDFRDHQIIHLNKLSVLKSNIFKENSIRNLKIL